MCCLSIQNGSIANTVNLTFPLETNNIVKTRYKKYYNTVYLFKKKDFYARQHVPYVKCHSMLSSHSHSHSLYFYFDTSCVSFKILPLNTKSVSTLMPLDRAAPPNIKLNVVLPHFGTLL